MDGILAMFEDGVTGDESTQTRPEGHWGDPHFWTAIHIMKKSILNFTTRHFNITIPRLRHKFLGKLANRIILLHDVPCRDMLGHGQASSVKPELLIFHVFTPLKKSSSVESL